MPGITITTDVRSAAAGTNLDVSGQVFMVGEAERGPDDEAVLLTSFSDYLRLYGLYELGNLYINVRTFFSEGGSRCWIRRVTGDGSTAASASLNSSSAALDVIYKLATPITFGDINLDGSDLAASARSAGNYNYALVNSTTMSVFPAAADDAPVLSGDSDDIRIVNLGSARTSDGLTWTDGASQTVLDASAIPQELRDSADGEVIRIVAANPGDWANSSLSVRVVEPNTLGNGCRVRVFFDGSEIYTTQDFTNSQDGIYDLNHSGFEHLFIAERGSRFGDATRPDVFDSGDSNVSLTGGVTEEADNDEIIDGLSSFDHDYGVGVVCAPEHNSFDVWTALRDHGQENNRMAFVTFDSNVRTVSAANAAVDGYGVSELSRYQSAYYPYIEVSSPSENDTNDPTFARDQDTLFISPVSYAAAVRNRAIQEGGGPWIPYAGDISTARTIVGLQDLVADEGGTSLDDARINAIRRLGTDIKVYGARSLSTDEVHWRFNTYQDAMNFIIDGCESILEPFLFQPIDNNSSLFSSIRGALRGFLEEIRLQNGLYSGVGDNGELVDPGYSINVSDTNNPPDELARGRINANISLRVAPVADRINVRITKASAGADV